MFVFPNGFFWGQRFPSGPEEAVQLGLTIPIEHNEQPNSYRNCLKESISQTSLCNNRQTIFNKNIQDGHMNGCHNLFQ